MILALVILATLMLLFGSLVLAACFHADSSGLSAVRAVLTMVLSFAALPIALLWYLYVRII